MCKEPARFTPNDLSFVGALVINLYEVGGKGGRGGVMMKLLLANSSVQEDAKEECALGV